MKKQLSALALLLCWLTTANAAALLYDSSDGRTSFRPGSSLSLSFGWLVRDFRPTWADTVQLPAMPFVLSSAAELQSVDLALTALAFWSQDYRVRVLQDQNGYPGVGTIWEADSRGAVPVFSAGSTYEMTHATGSAATLFADTLYRLQVTRRRRARRA